MQSLQGLCYPACSYEGEGKLLGSLNILFVETCMAMTAQQQKEIIAKESAWVDDSFGQLDLTAFPALQPPHPETSRDDGRFARDWRDTALSASASELRKFVSDPD